MRAERIDFIESYIKEKKNVSLDELCEKFAVSKNTIRRDIDALVKRGHIKKVYGGVTYEDSQAKALTSFEERDACFTREKNNICRKAAAFVKDHDVIYIDTGTTCINLIDYIRDKKCTILTNSLQIALKALPYSNLNIIMLPGKLMRTTLSFVGSELTNYLKTYNISKAFMACTGLTIQTGLTNASTEEHRVKKSIMDNSMTHFLLADHSKFGRFALMTYASLSQIDHLITDCAPEESYRKYCAEHQVQLHITNI